jgi:hypothetical protein
VVQPLTIVALESVRMDVVDAIWEGKPRAICYLMAGPGPPESAHAHPSHLFTKENDVVHHNVFHRSDVVVLLSPFLGLVLQLPPFYYLFAMAFVYLYGESTGVQSTLRKESGTLLFPKYDDEASSDRIERSSCRQIRHRHREGFRAQP